MNTFKIKGKIVGTMHKPYIIAEIGQAHDGSLGLAHAYIEAVAAAGADAVKFQTHFASEESTKDEPWRIKFSYQDDSRYEYWQRMEFTEEQWKGLKEHAEKLEIDFISTPFSSKAIKLLDKLDVPLWKISSGDINNLPLLKEIAQTGKPVVLSSGMSPVSEVDTAVDLLREHKVPFAVLQCTTAYPCPVDKIGLNNIQEFSSRYACPAGLSDHSGRPFAGLAAVALGASILEVHVVFDKKMFGPDVSSSLTFDELRMLVEGSHDIYEMKQNPVDKDKIADEEMEPLRKLFHKSIVLSNDVKAGSQLSLDDLSFKKPGKGITPEQVDLVVGRVLKQTFPRDHFLSFDDFEGAHENK
jgi:N-acetylneuraminate synthase